MQNWGHICIEMFPWWPQLWNWPSLRDWHSLWDWSSLWVPFEYSQTGSVPQTGPINTNWAKGLGSRTCRIGLPNWRQNQSLNKSGKAHFCMSPISTFTNTSYSAMLILHAFAIRCYIWVGWPLFDVLQSLLRLWAQIWQGAQPTYKMKFWQYLDLAILNNFLWE